MESCIIWLLLFISSGWAQSATPAPTSSMLQNVDLPLEPTFGSIIGYVDVSDEMYLGIEFTIHSWPAGWSWCNIFQCGTADLERYPGLFIHASSGVDGAAFEGLLVVVNSNDGNSVGGLMGDALSLETLYHVEVYFTQSWYTVVVNNETLYDGAKGAHPTTYHMPCYSGFPYHSAANVTITALDMWTTATMYPTVAPEPTTEGTLFYLCIS